MNEERSDTPKPTKSDPVPLIVVGGTLLLMLVFFGGLGLMMLIYAPAGVEIAPGPGPLVQPTFGSEFEACPPLTNSEQIDFYLLEKTHEALQDEWRESLTAYRTAKATRESDGNPSESQSASK